MGFILVILLISLPIFYLYGLVSFIRDLSQSLNKSKRTQPKPFVTPHIDDVLYARLKKQSETNPNRTIAAFFEEYRQYRAKPRLSDLNQSSTPPHLVVDSATKPKDKPTVTTQPENKIEKTEADFLSNWYADNSINVLLYLGAFLIVAAVSLFISFQWQSFGGTTKFILVVGFTILWFIAGHIFTQIKSVASAGVSFLTIGALLVPFCGVAFQRFVLTDPSQAIGLTWLITSIIAIGVYLYLTIYIKRRYFTYFAQLSMLSTSLSIVNISESPTEYYVLASVATALLLLCARVFLVPLVKQKDYFARDVEVTSIVTLITSLSLGLAMMSERGIEFFGPEVALVSLLTAIYAWLYFSLRRLPTPLAVAQVVTSLTVGHIVRTLGFEPFVALYAIAITNFAIQLGLNQLLMRQKNLFTSSKITSILLTLLVYVLSLCDHYNSFNTLVFSLLFGLHSLVVASDLDQPWWHFGTSISIFSSLAHIFWLFELETLYAPLVFSLTSAALLSVHYWKGFNLPKEAYRISGLVGLLLTALIAIMSSQSSIHLIKTYGDNYEHVALSVAFFAVIAYNLHALYVRAESIGQTDTRTKLAAPGLDFVSRALATAQGGELMLMVVGSITIYLSVWAITTSYWAGILAFLVGTIAFLLSVRLSWHGVIYVSIVSWYLAAWHFLYWLGSPDWVNLLTPALLSAAIFLCHRLSKLPAQYVSSFKLSGTSGACLTAIMGYAWSLSLTGDGLSRLDLACLVSGYVAFALLWLWVDQHPSKFRWHILGGLTLLLYYWHWQLLAESFPLLPLDNIQWLSLPLGAYLVGLSWLEAKRNSKSDSILLLDLASAAVILFPTILQSLYHFDNSYLFYSLLTALYGIGFVVLGNSWQRRLYQQIGAAALVIAVLTATSEYLFNLPKWLLIGLVGFGFIAMATYLLIRRSDKE